MRRAGNPVAIAGELKGTIETLSDSWSTRVRLKFELLGETEEVGVTVSMNEQKGALADAISRAVAERVAERISARWVSDNFEELAVPDPGSISTGD